jgi:hypothetical protein
MADPNLDIMDDMGYGGLGAIFDPAQTGGFSGFLKNLGLLGGLASGVGGAAAVKSAYDRLGAIGEAAQQGALGIAQQGLEQTKFQPFTVTSTTGGAFGVTPTEGGGVAAQMALSPEEQAMQQRLFGGAGGFYGQAMMPTAAREADVYERIRSVQSPEEQRQRLALEERLAGQGRLGVRTAMFGGTPEQLALAQAQEEARNRAALSAIQQAQAEQMQQAQLGQQFLAGAYVPQAQLLNVQQAAQLFPQLAQRGQLYGAGLFGEAAMGGLEALLGAGLGQANLMGQLGTGLLTGLATPTDSYGGLGDVLGDAVKGIGGLFGNIFS